MDNGISEAVHILLGLSHKVKRKTERAPLPHSGKGTYGLDGVLKEF
jgi:hypothetical protein